MGLLDADSLFDLAFYSAESCLSFASRDTGVEHFLTMGEKLGLSPSPPSAQTRYCISRTGDAARGANPGRPVAANWRSGIRR